MYGIISVGERPVQNQYRVNVSKDLCEAHDIDVGDRIEIWIKKVKTKDMGAAPFKRGVDILDEIAESQTETFKNQKHRP